MNSISDITAGWTKKEFLAFLLLHVANADLELSQEELMAIDALVDEKQFKTIQMIWSKCNDIECINIIKELRNKYFPGDDGKEVLIGEMTKLAGLDEKLNISEEIMILSLKKLL
ncbi:MAG: hypothetical protein P8100_01035 [bacterium]|jgi:hypothetical protein